MSQSVKKFEEILSQLNSKQREAVETIEGPVLVIAGPGTGKTHILSARVGQILKQTDASPYNILCLTFTDAGVRAMRERLQSIMGAEANAVHIFTFHGFCNKIIQENIGLFGKNELSLIDDLERRQLIRELLAALSDEKLAMSKQKNQEVAHSSQLTTHSPFFYEKQINHLFALMKKEAWTSDYVLQQIDIYLASIPLSGVYIYKTTKKGVYSKGDIKTAELEAERERMLKLREAAKLYDTFEKLMRDNQYYDFDDMVTWVINAFQKHNYLLRHYQEQYLYMLVDEFQDTNGAQNKMLSQLIDFWESPNIFIVGDDDQAIYEFQGARLHNLIEFYEKYRNELKVIVLKDNYRSTQKILDVSKKLIDNNEIRIVNRLSALALEKTLVAHQPSVKNSVQVMEYPNRLYELHDIAEKITDFGFWSVDLKNNTEIQNLKSKIQHPKSSIAVIYSQHREAETLIRLFEQRGIPYQTKRRLNILDAPLIQNLRLLLSYLAAETDKPFSADALLFKILHFRFWNIPIGDVMQLAMDIAKKSLVNTGTAFLEGIDRDVSFNEQQYHQKYWRNSLKSQSSQPIFLFSKLLEDWCIEAITTSPINVLEKILLGGNILSWVNAQPERVMYLQLLNSFFEFVRSETYKNPRLTLQQLVNTLDLLEKNAMPIELVQNIVRPDGVVLTTAHAAKGLEFDHVFLMNAVESSWEKNKSGTGNAFKLPNNLTYSTEEDAVEARRRLFYVATTRAKTHLHVSYSLQDEKGKATMRSQFIDELQPIFFEDTRQDLPPQKNQSNTEPDSLSLLMQPAPKPSPPILDAAFINDMLFDFRLSASSLQIYLTCPLQFFYEYILKIPSLPSVSALYGNAIHEALQKLFSTMLITSDKKFPEKKFFLNYFERALQRQRGFFPEKNYILFLERGLENLSQYYDKFIAGGRSENVRVEASINTEYKNIPLQGKIDKIVFKDNNTAQVFDYKTGNFKTSDVAVPSAKNTSGGKYLRQLIFYKILYENYRAHIVTVEQGIVDYVEPKSNGNFDKKEIAFDEIYVQLIQNDIISTWQKIKNHEFTGCGKPDCAWCRFFTKNQYATSLVDEDVESLDD